MRTNSTLVQFQYDGNVTKCNIKDRKTKETIITSISKRRKTDVYNKSLGRKLAFQRAMTQAVLKNILPREERTALWNNFRTVVKQPKFVN